MNKECVAQKHYSKIQSPEFNNAAIVEYTAAIPEAKPPAVPSILHTFHKLISVRCCSGYKYLSFSSANDARMSSASSNKTRS
jgi:hypothetical protein